MKTCPHCGTNISYSEMIAKRLLTERTCGACHGRYTDGGTTYTFSLIAGMAAVGAHLQNHTEYPSWYLQMAMLFGFVAVVMSLLISRPIKSSAIRSKVVEAIIWSPIVFAAVLCTMTVCSL